MDKDKCNLDLSCRKNKVGGQAVIEGVMMKNGQEVALAVRKGDGTIEIKKSTFTPLKAKHKWLNIPIIRGIFGFFESLVLSFKTLGSATDMLDLDDDGKKKDDKDKEKKKDGSSTSTILMMGVSLVLGLCLALFLFSALPTIVAELLVDVFDIEQDSSLYFPIMAVTEGVMKVAIFIGYLLLVSLMKDIRRTFEYHGAEHKSIACFEKGLELTPENAKKCTRYHPRCGTSFMFVMILLSIIIGLFIQIDGPLRIIVKIAILPLIMGIGYEFIMLAGKHDNKLTRALSAPGLWMQRITTKEPNEYQLAVAICAIKASMPELFPDFSPEEYFMNPEDDKKHLLYEDKKSEKKGTDKGAATDEANKKSDTPKDEKQRKAICFGKDAFKSTSAKISAGKRGKESKNISVTIKSYK